MTTLRMVLVCCVVLVGGISGLAHAFSLGELQLMSKPGQPFQATAPIKLGKDEKISSVAVGSTSDYALLNLPHTAGVNMLTAQIKEQSDGPVVLLQSNTPIQEEDFFILLRVASNQHTFFPFFRLRSAAAVASQEQPKQKQKQKQKQPEQKKAQEDDIIDLPLTDHSVTDLQPPTTEDGKPLEKATLGKIPFFAMADKAITASKEKSTDQKDAAPSTLAQTAMPRDQMVALAQSTGKEAKGSATSSVDDEPPVSPEQKQGVPEKVAEKAPEKATKKAPEKVAEKAPEKVAEKAPEKVAEKAPEKVAEKAPEKVAEKTPEKVAEKVAEKAPEKAPEKAAQQSANLRTPATTPGDNTAAPDGGPLGKKESYGPIREGENLSGIVHRLNLAKGKISFFQAVVALWRANPDQFIRNNMNGINTGAMLKIPSPQEIAQTDPQEAREIRLSHALVWKKPYSERENMPMMASSTPERTGSPTLSSAPEVDGTLSTKMAAPSQEAPKPSAETPPRGGENEELRAILTQLQVITRVLESNQAQQDRLEQRISTLEQARKEWDFLRERINELEHAKTTTQPGSSAEQASPFAALLERTDILSLGIGIAGLVVVLALLFLWLGRRWNQADRWKSLQALLSDTARQDPHLLRQALQDTEPTFSQEFVPAVRPPKLEGVAPSLQKRVVEGDVTESANKLQAMTGNKE